MTPAQIFTYLCIGIAMLALGVWGWRQNRAARKTEGLLATLQAQSHVGVVCLNAEQHVIQANEGLARWLDTSSAAMQGKPWTEFESEADRGKTAELIVGRTGVVLRPHQGELTLVGPKGLPRPVQVSALPLPGQSSSHCTLLLVEDFLQRKAYEASLSQQLTLTQALIDLPRLAERLSEQELMQRAIEMAESLTQSRIGFIHFVNADASIELVTWSRRTLAEYCHAVHDSHYPLTQAGVWADAARTSTPVVINDYATVPNKRGLPEGHAHLQRLVSIPVIELGSVRLMLGVGNKSEDYSTADVEICQLIGNEVWRIVSQERGRNALLVAQQVVNASPVVCFRWRAEPDWPVDYVSENVSQWGYASADLRAGKPAFATMVHPDDLARVVAEVTDYTARHIDEYALEYRLLTGDGRVIWVLDRTRVLRFPDGRPRFFDGVLTDISERRERQMALSEALAQQQQLNKRLEEANNQLLQSEKMASIGQLAAGVAHELNNPIGFVHSNLGTLEGYLRDLMTLFDKYDDLVSQLDDATALAQLQKLAAELDIAYVREDIFKLVDESKEGLARVRKIVQDLKSFSRVGEQDWRYADLHQGLDSTLNIVWNELKYKCTVDKDYGDIPPVYCLISQLNQVFMNLLVNAGHAIAEKGTITVRTRRHGDDAVEVAVIDSGHGIPPEHRQRIFEPFFTTKPVGKGTGLGLSLSYSIVERHRGRFEVESEVGVGTTFRVILPIDPPQAADATPVDQP